MGLEIVIDRTIFLTGAQRSGTTLLQKLLDMQVAVSILSQPMPLLFVDVKRAFLKELGAADAYPLGHLFLETRYERAQFEAFLTAWRAAEFDLTATFRSMEQYSGQYTRIAPNALRRAIDRVGSSHGFAGALADILDAITGREDATWFGSKETSAEEYVPHLLAQGVRCIVIIRDPRDVVTSLNHGRGETFAGAPKPTLFNVRSWRKSVATLLAMQGQRYFHWCRYEDLVHNPGDAMQAIAEALELDVALDLPIELRDADGALWSGNSSHSDFHGIGTGSIGRYRDVLPPDTARFIEAAALPELQILGYKTTMDRPTAREMIGGFREHLYQEREGLSADWVSPANTRVEQERLERVTAPGDEDTPAWFLFTETHARLREAFRP